MNKKIYFLALLFLSALFNHSLRSQSFSDLVKQLGVQDLASQYLKPAADAIGFSFNSGLYHTAHIDNAFHVYVGLKGMWAFIPESDLTFEAKFPAYLTALGYPTKVTTATAFGDKGAVLRSSMKDSLGKNYPDILLPNGINTRATFLFVPHVTIGQVAATELMIRVIPPLTLDPEIGKLSLYGGGIKHSPSQYLNLPVDVAVMIAFQKFKVGDALDVTNYNANIHASKNLTFVTLYGGFGYEGYDIKALYTYKPDPNISGIPSELKNPQAFSLDFTGRNFRFTVGASVEFIPLVDFNVDYSFGVHDVLTVGAGISL